jgi:hypothetical protein
MSIEDGIEGELANISSMSAGELRSQWQVEFGEDAPRISSNLLRRALTYAVQERVHGKLAPSTSRSMEELASGGGLLPPPSIKLKPGTRLLREWSGRMHSVLVREDGFEFDGKVFTSLSKVARRITGAHWSGPRFFGLQRRPANAQVTASYDGQ